jgi:soluble lytic murein transglycosylase-like protein
MKKSHVWLSLKVLFASTLLKCHLAYADIYIDTSPLDEISITNTANSESYTFKIEEPTNHAVVRVQHHHKKSISVNLPYQHEVAIAANETAVEPALIQAVMTVESRHNPQALSKKGAYGLMQLMPETSNRFKVNNIKDPKQNILAGTRYLRELLDLYKGDLTLVLAAYNAGPAAVKKYGGHIPPYQETIHYVPKVLKYYQLYSSVI